MNHAPLGSLCSFTNGGTPPKSVDAFWNGNIPWITSADIDEGEVSIGRSFINEEAIQSSATNRVRRGTVLLVSRTGVGKVTQAPIDLCFSQDITAIEPNDHGLDRRYLVRFLEASQAHFERHARGATIRGITREVIAQLRVPLPPPNEQRRIAAILDKADALRRKRKQAIDLIEQGRDSLVESELRANSNGELEALEGYLEFITTGGRNWSQYYSEQGARFIRSLDVQMNSISDEDPVYVIPPNNAEALRTSARQGDVLLTVTGSRIGRVAELPANLSGCYVSQHVAILRLNPKKLRPKFLSFFLSSRAGQLQIQKWQYGQTKPGLNFKQIGSFLVPRIGIDLQVRLERAVERFEVLKRVQEGYGAGLTNLFRSLQSRAFSGRL
jgi:type I restriction enzyme, S subunit